MPIIKVKNRNTNGSPILGEDEKIVYTDEASWYGTDKKQVGEEGGVLYVTDKNVIWLDSKDKESGYSIDYRSLTMHAVSSDPNHFSDAEKFLYCQIGFEGEDFYLVTKSDVQKAYEAICTCSELNPDPEDDGEAGNELFSLENPIISREGGDNVDEKMANLKLNGS
mmetsp:Transcript_28534/g.39814  ORF Transcript_28534/g.39814 Transcript_28534/m.39814 type:complete len:166 (+) Transcript_28534:97-594(+)|eukprot:CAMPEP_0185256100 /NCGR_PEP_ID=MMETSP1359-20130426/5177_1 /TAXON_ID=552665 /ORGANISM="Bigelowiella longifila, Strain CCMP242" /LENGTH=165 /DNA_ID=CAMNT_0027840455 /DNA_START=60 /DNA_END=557 /DNA_ORIENTATION=+